MYCMQQSSRLFQASLRQGAGQVVFFYKISISFLTPASSNEEAKSMACLLLSPAVTSLTMPPCSSLLPAAASLPPSIIFVLGRFPHTPTGRTTLPLSLERPIGARGQKLAQLYVAFNCFKAPRSGKKWGRWREGAEGFQVFAGAAKKEIGRCFIIQAIVVQNFLTAFLSCCSLHVPLMLNHNSYSSICSTCFQSLEFTFFN